MIYRTFGRMGWSVSEIDYGMWGLAGWTGSDETEMALTARLDARRLLPARPYPDRFTGRKSLRSSDLR